MNSQLAATAAPPSGPARRAERDPPLTAQPDEVREATLEGVRWGTLARVGIETAALLSTIVLARLVSPAGFGRAAIAVALITVATALVVEGFGTPLVQRKAVTHAHLETTLLLSALVGFGLSVATFLLAPLASSFGGPEVSDLVRIASPAFLFVSLAVVPQAIAQRRMDFRRTSLVDMTSLVIGVSVAIVLAAIGLGDKALVLGQLAIPAAAALLYFRLARGIRPRWHRKEARDVVGFGSQTSASSLLSAAWMNLDYVVVGATLGPAATGFYWRAFQIGGVYQGKISQIMVRIALPVFSRTRDLAEMRRIRRRIVRMHALVIFPLLATYILVAARLVPLAFGERWTPAVVPSQILALAGMIFALATGTGALVLAAGHPRAQLLNSLITCLLYAAVVIAFARLGLTVLCVAVVAVNVVTYLGQYKLLVQRLVGIPFSDLWGEIKPALGGLVGLLALGGLCSLGLAATDLPSILQIILVSAVSGSAYLATVRIGFPDAWADIRMIAARMTSRKKAA